jgi:glycosyltransferase involved in cell wall biosynthesis
VPASKIVTLPEGVNLSVFMPPQPHERAEVRRELGIPADAFVVGSFQKDGDGMKDGATPKMIKGPDVLVDVLTALHARGPVHALLPGPARGYVTRRLTEAGVPFTAPGFVPRASLPRLYHALDVYLSPSRDEGGPAGVLESMASGVPVVSTRSGMPADILEDGVNGGLVEVDDVTGLVERMASLMNDVSARRRWADRALQTIQPYDWRVLGPRYAAELYWSEPGEPD